MSDFDLLDRPLLWLEVKWPGVVPGGADGQALAVAVEHRIEVRVEMKDNEDVKALAYPDPDAPSMSKIDAMMAFVSDWRKVKASGRPVPFSRENMGIMLDRQGAFFDGFRVAYVNATIGKVETREGNSDGLPPAGQAAEAQSGSTENPKPSEIASGSE